MVYSQDGNEDETVIKEITYTVPWTFDESSQWVVTAFVNNQWINAMSAGLFDKSKTDERRIVPYLAEDYPILSNNDHVWTVKLKPDIMFSTGHTLTADDVVFTYQVAMTPEINRISGSVFHPTVLADYLKSNASIKVIDETTVEFTFEKIAPTIYSILQLNIIELDLFAELYTDCKNGISSSCEWSSVDGQFAMSAGPYKLDKIDPNNESVTLVRNEHYSLSEKVWADKINFEFIEKTEDAKIALKSNMTDILAPQFLYTKSDFEGINGINISQVSYKNVQEVWLNHKHPYYGSGILIPDGTGASDNDNIQAVYLRQAMSHALDRQKIIDTIADGLGTPAASPWAPGVDGYDPSILPQEFSIDIAKESMVKAGFSYSSISDANGDGDYGDAGDTTFFDINYLLPWNFSTPQRVEWAKLYVQDLTKIGIGIKSFNEESWDVIGPRTFGYREGEFIPLYENDGYDVLFVGLVWTDLELPVDVYGVTGACDSDEGCSFLNYKNATILELYKELSNEFDQTKIQDLIRRFQLALKHELPTIPILHQMSDIAYNAELQNINFDALEGTELEWDKVYKKSWVIEKSDDGDSPLRIFNLEFLLLVLVSLSLYRKRREQIV